MAWAACFGAIRALTALVERGRFRVSGDGEVEHLSSPESGVPVGGTAGAAQASCKLSLGRGNEKMIQREARCDFSARFNHGKVLMCHEPDKNGHRNAEWKRTNPKQGSDFV